mmetsp:Transcript_100747/g.240133  ORF Transcript_100747/g.240133 Transcript_100747/m.240133 type:complete len:329 (-) Transcript_100747:633-1619(-)
MRSTWMSLVDIKEMLKRPVSLEVFKLGTTISGDPLSGIFNTAPTSAAEEYSRAAALEARTWWKKGFSASSPSSSWFRSTCTAAGPAFGKGCGVRMTTSKGGGGLSSSRTSSLDLRTAAWKDTNSSQVISRSASLSMDWKSRSMASREPSSCRISMGRPKNSAILASRRMALMSSRLFTMPLRCTSQLSNTARSLALSSRSDAAKGVPGAVLGRACIATSSREDKEVPGGVRPLSSMGIDSGASALVPTDTRNWGFRYQESSGALLLKRPPPMKTPKGRSCAHLSSNFWLDLLGSRRWGGILTTSTDSVAFTMSVKGPSSPLAAEGTMK